MRNLRKLAAFWGLATVVPLCACRPAQPPAPEVVVYTSVDQVFAEKILQRFEQDSGVRVRAVFDTEAGKTTGLLQRLRSEAPRPRCDVWWSSEIFGTIELAREGLLSPYQSPSAADIPGQWKDPQGRWTGLAPRARVVAYDPSRLSAEQVPGQWADYARPDCPSPLAIANPQFGTTRGHIAALFAYWGAGPATEFMQELHDAGVVLADGNAQSVRLVAEGKAALGWTDTDDVWVMQRQGHELALVYPRLSQQTPALWIPCAVALMKNGPNPEQARKLVDVLLSAATERALAQSDSRNVPLRAYLREELGFDMAPEPVDFDRVTDAIPAAMQATREILLR